MVKAMCGNDPPVEPQGLRGLEQRMGTDHIGANEVIGAQDRAVDVRFRREVHDRIDAETRE
jgi:fructose-specific phosphotransferase system component IIB